MERGLEIKKICMNFTSFFEYHRCWLGFFNLALIHFFATFWALAKKDKKAVLSLPPSTHYLLNDAL